MRIRGAGVRDTAIIKKLFDEYEFKLDTPHLERIIIAEDDNGKPIAVMSLNTVLECCFLTVNGSHRRDKIEALKLLVETGKTEVKNIGYDLVHAFANDKIEGILKKHFCFEDAKGKNLVLFVE